MAASIITKRQYAPEREKLTKPEHYSEHHENVVVDSRYENLANLITHIEGANWKVNYYQQILEEHTALAGHNPTKDPIYQQYLKIEEMILKVDTALNWQQTNETKSGVVTGSAHVYPPFIPNQGDMFIGDIGDGNAAIFQVTVSEKLSLFKESVYRIEYTLIDYAEGDRVVNLDKKVVETRYFDHDFLEYGQNPVILKEEKKFLNALRHYYPIISENYFKRYFSSRFKCMILPRDDIFIYDHFLTNAIASWYTTNDYHKLIELTIPPVMQIPVMRAESIFNLIEDQDDYASHEIFTKVGMINVKQYAISGRLPQSARMGIDFLIYPLDHSYSVDTKDKHTVKFNIAPTPIPEFPYPQYQKTYADIPLVPIIDLNESYIFSRNFYLKETHLTSHLEIQLMRYFRGDMIIKEILYELMESHPHWSPIQQFYLTPILLMLIKASIRGL